MWLSYQLSRESDKGQGHAPILKGHSRASPWQPPNMFGGEYGWVHTPRGGPVDRAARTLAGSCVVQRRPASPNVLPDA